MSVTGKRYFESTSLCSSSKTLLFHKAISLITCKYKLLIFIAYNIIRSKLRKLKIVFILKIMTIVNTRSQTYPKGNVSIACTCTDNNKINERS